MSKPEKPITIKCHPGLDPGSRGSRAERDPGLPTGQAGSKAGMTAGFLGLFTHPEIKRSGLTSTVITQTEKSFA